MLRLPSAGKLACGGENQQRVFAAAAAGGGGVLHAVPRGSSHSNFDDVLLLYGKTLTWVLQALDFKTALEPAKVRVAVKQQYNSRVHLRRVLQYHSTR